MSFASVKALAWGAPDPSESRAYHPHPVNRPHNVRCSSGMTATRSAGHSMTRLGRDLAMAAEAGGYRAPASSNSGYNSRAQIAIDWLMNHKYSTAQGDCAINTRKGLAAAGLIPNLGIGHANQFVGGLQRHCFQNMIGRYPTPESAPAGAVLVYAGISMRGDKNAKFGHVEVRTSVGYVSDYFSSRPRTGGGSSGRNRRLIGVMLKNDGGSYKDCRR